MKLAEDYIKDMYNGDTDFLDEAENVIQWILKDNYIINRNEAKEVYNSHIEDIKRGFRILPETIKNYLQAAYRSALIRLFGNEIRN